MTERTGTRITREDLPHRDPGSGTTEPAGQTVTALRRFARGRQLRDDEGGLSPLTGRWLPALLHRYREESRVRTPYPFYLPDPASGVDGGEPVEGLLRRVLGGIEVDPGARQTLQDNLDRFEQAVRQEMEGAASARPAGEVLEAAGQAALGSFVSSAKESLTASWSALVAGVPPGVFLPFDDSVALRLWVQAASVRAQEIRSRLQGELRDLLRRVRQRLELEEGGRAERTGLGEGSDQLLDLGALSRVSRSRAGRVSMEPARLQALREASGALGAFLDGAPPPALIVVRAEPGGPALGHPDVVLEVNDPDPSGRALDLWDAEGRAWAELLRAIRRCELEADGVFEPERHEPALEALGLDDLAEDELIYLPPVVAVESASRLRDEALSSLSRVLRSRRPVHVLVSVDPFDDTDISRARLELGYLAIGHRGAAVHQGTVSEPGDLLGSFRTLSMRLEPSLHLIAVSGGDAAPGPWLHLGAAVEGRAHPLFIYDPQTGSSWARRLDFGGNPAPEVDWPVYPFVHREGDAEKTADFAFTFADFALLEPGAREHFREVPEGIDDPDLVDVGEILSGPAEARSSRIAFVWAVDDSGRLARLAVTDALVRAARDRLDFWRTLQELAGIRNEHVLTAVAAAEESARDRADAERMERDSVHAKQLEEARAEAGREALAGVARFLLGLDGTPPGGFAGGLIGSAPRATGLVAAPAPVSAGVSPPEVAVEPATTAEAPKAAPSDEPEDPWVDTILCTSCNDCVQINPRLFVYDENKQVRIGDPEAGTYAQLIAAAEKCPSRCIHPGTPLDPDEPGLDELKQRALPYR